MKTAKKTTTQTNASKMTTSMLLMSTIMKITKLGVIIRNGLRLKRLSPGLTPPRVPRDLPEGKLYNLSSRPHNGHHASVSRFAGDRNTQMDTCLRSVAEHISLAIQEEINNGIPDVNVLDFADGRGNLQRYIDDPFNGSKPSNSIGLAHQSMGNNVKRHSCALPIPHDITASFSVDIAVFFLSHWGTVKIYNQLHHKLPQGHEARQLRYR
ncbi:hypothetical protein DFJ77DRAFT_257164 [Powellomyces hirtus]|nr:hypothetical protein DFJ77DRAFT_257164 [Powellomyces hirtus]